MTPKTIDLANHHNVYIFGAGLSKVRGLPVIGDFMIALRDAHPWLLSEGRRREADAVAKVLQYRLSATAAAYRVKLDLENIEELFSLADAGKEVLSRDVRLAIAATIDFRRSTIEEPFTTFFTPNSFTGPVGWTHTPHGADQKAFKVSTIEFFMQALIASDWKSEVVNTIVTFNYDCLVEDALSKLYTPFHYGFKPKSVIVDPSTSVLQLKADAELPVLKLHGSTNWARLSSRRATMSVFGGYSDVLARDAVPELVAPTWRKLLARELLDVWKTALERITVATRIVVIGFSMPETDMHFKYLLAAGLRENISLREIVFVNPDSLTITQRAESLFGSLENRPPVRIIAKGVGHFVGAGTSPEQIGSIDRPVPVEITRIQHGAY